MQKLADEFVKVKVNGRTFIGIEVLEKENKKLNRSVYENEKGEQEISVWVEGEPEGAVYFKIVDGEVIPLEPVPVNENKWLTSEGEVVLSPEEEKRYLDTIKEVVKDKTGKAAINPENFKKFKEEEAIAKATREAKEHYHNSEEFKEKVAEMDRKVIGAIKEAMGNSRNFSACVSYMEIVEAENKPCIRPDDRNTAIIREELQKLNCEKYLFGDYEIFLACDEESCIKKVSAVSKPGTVFKAGYEKIEITTKEGRKYLIKGI